MQQNCAFCSPQKGRASNSQHQQKSTMKTTPFFIAVTTFFLLTTKPLFAWSGYDFDNKTEVEIGEGNLVREGLMIQFYDSKFDNYRTVKVLFIDSIAGGTRIQVKDLETAEERTLIMNEEK
jgi:hypothetical protein